MYAYIILLGRLYSCCYKDKMSVITRLHLKCDWKRIRKQHFVLNKGRTRFAELNDFILDHRYDLETRIRNVIVIGLMFAINNDIQNDTKSK
ncbi:hypothetical protein EWB00_010485 [Schistosoma japonicum]|uniref:Uncharacterized protein n=1 Tax=Schistosoma japonicum TaxID=6182 RepID=A0A4Z2DXQ3_SCHJA|nr:hypothetical protein EWB00_010485 [Schistosoma japonicum]